MASTETAGLAPPLKCLVMRIEQKLVSSYHRQAGTRPGWWDRCSSAAQSFTGGSKRHPAFVWTACLPIHLSETIVIIGQLTIWVDKLTLWNIHYETRQEAVRQNVWPPVWWNLEYLKSWKNVKKHWFWWVLVKHDHIIFYSLSSYTG